MKASFLSGALLSALVACVSAQTFTPCNPLKKNCPADAALGTSFNETFNLDSSFESDYWIQNAGTLSYDQDGAKFQIAQHGDAPTITTKFYIFWGRVEVLMKAAQGQGIISSIVMLSDDLDEIDWEIMGGNSTHIETNYYGKGDVSQSNALYYPCDNPQGSHHNYTVVWNSDQLEWHLDGKLVRTLPYGQAVKGGKTIYPQTPSFLRIGNWAGGDPSEPLGTRQWAGGPVNFDDGPFDMYVKSVKVVDGTGNAKSYSYSDETGNWQSIKVERGTSDASEKIHAPPPLTASQRWNNLSSGAQIGIICGVAGFTLLLMGLFIFYCIRQRRIGKRERAAADAAWDKEQAELDAYKRRMQRGDFGVSKNPAYIGVVRPQR